MDTIPYRFLVQAIDVEFDTEPTLEKKPCAPSRFFWSGEKFPVIRVLSEWFDFSRKGRMQRNMSPAHAHHAAITGSWGVGRFTFRILTTDDRVFDIYYDRSPNDAADRKGHWFVLEERKLIKNNIK